MSLRRDPSLRRMAIVSLIVHIAVFMLVGLNVFFQARRYVAPNPYFVNLVAPSPPKKKAVKTAGKTAKKASAPAKKIKKPVTPKKPATKKKTITKKKPVANAVKKKPAAKTKKRPSALKPDKPEPTATESPEERVRGEIERLKKINQLERLQKLRESIGGYKLEAKEEGGADAESRKVASQEAMAVYYGIIRYRVLERWVYTGASSGNLEAEVLISLSTQGGVQKQRIVKSSGNADFDRSVLRAIAKASPFPPPPEGVDTEIQFRFRPGDIQ